MRIKIPGRLYVAIISTFLGTLATSFLPATVLAAPPVCSWTGSGGNALWSNSGNWNCTSGTLPVNSDSVVFDDSLSPFSVTPVTQDISNLQLDTITFTGSSTLGGYTIGGSTTITLTGGIVINSTGIPFNHINVGITLANDLTFTDTETMVFSGGPVTIGTHTLTLTGTAGYVFNAPIVGSGTVHENVTNTDDFMSWDSPNFTGQLIVSHSVVFNSDHPNALGSSTVTVDDGGTLTFQANSSGTFTISNALHLGGVGNTNSSAQLSLANQTGGLPVTMNFTGPVTLSANTQAKTVLIDANFTGPTTGCPFSISQLAGSTGTLNGSLTGTCASPSSGGGSDDTTGTPKDPDTGYGSPADSRVYPLLFLLSSTCLVLGTHLFHTKRHTQ